MKTFEEFLDAEIEEFESPEFQSDFDQLSVARRNNILFKRLLFDYDEELKVSLKKFISSNGNEPHWQDLTSTYPELNYIVADQPDPVIIARIVQKEISLA